jgi:hypothetical protein
MKKMNQTAELQTGQTCGFRSSIADAPDWWIHIFTWKSMIWYLSSILYLYHVVHTNRSENRWFTQNYPRYPIRPVIPWKCSVMYAREDQKSNFPNRLNDHVRNFRSNTSHSYNSENLWRPWCNSSWRIPRLSVEANVAEWTEHASDSLFVIRPAVTVSRFMGVVQMSQGFGASIRINWWWRGAFSFQFWHSDASTQANRTIISSIGSLCTVQAKAWPRFDRCRQGSE